MTEVGRGYEFFDHTADIGIRAQGSTLSELFVRMAQGLTELLAEDSRLPNSVGQRARNLGGNDDQRQLKRRQCCR